MHCQVSVTPNTLFPSLNYVMFCLQLIRQRAFLREERRRLRIATEGTEERAKLLKGVQSPDWLPEQLRSMLLSGASTVPQEFHPTSENESGSLPILTTSSSSSGPMKTHSAEETVQINIGGLMFETPVSVLMRDPHSLLAQLCPGSSPSSSPLILADPDGFFYFDRDWWVSKLRTQWWKADWSWQLSLLPLPLPLHHYMPYHGSSFSLPFLIKVNNSTECFNMYDFHI